MTTAFDLRRVRYEQLHHLTAQHFSTFFKSTLVRPDFQVLDCGSGYGAGTRELLLHRWHGESMCVDLVDESVLQIQRAREDLDVYIAGTRDSRNRRLQLRFETKAFPHGFAPERKYDLAMAKMVLHEIPQCAQLEFMRALWRALVPGGSLLYWDVSTLLPETRNFLQDVIRKKDELAEYYSMFERRHWLTECDTKRLFECAELTSPGVLGRFNYVFSTRRRLDVELRSDERKLDTWHTFIRARRSRLTCAACRELDITDNGHDIAMYIPMVFLSANRRTRSTSICTGMATASKLARPWLKSPARPSVLAPSLCRQLA